MHRKFRNCTRSCSLISLNKKVSLIIRAETYAGRVGALVIDSNRISAFVALANLRYINALNNNNNNLGKMTGQTD